MITIRDAREDDAKALLEIYSYYVEHTAISFELTTPSLSEFKRRLTEIQTVPGYSLLPEPVFEGAIAKDQELDLSFTVVNAPAFEMPMTGGNGFAFTAVSTFAALLSAAALMLLWKKHNEKASHEAHFNNRW